MPNKSKRTRRTRRPRSSVRKRTRRHMGMKSRKGGQLQGARKIVWIWEDETKRQGHFGTDRAKNAGWGMFGRSVRSKMVDHELDNLNTIIREMGASPYLDPGANGSIPNDEEGFRFDGPAIAKRANEALDYISKTNKGDDQKLTRYNKWILDGRMDGQVPELSTDLPSGSFSDASRSSPATLE